MWYELAGVLILKLIGLADVDAHLGRVPLDRGVADPVDLPVGGRIARFRVLARDLIGHRRGAGVGCEGVSSPQRREHHDREQRNREQAEWPEKTHPYMERPWREPKFQPRSTKLDLFG